MSDDSDHAPPIPTQTGGPLAFLRRMPLAVRMLVYGTSFLAFILVLLPWLAYRLDVYVPAVHVELGWFRAVGAVFGCVCLVIYIRTSYVLTSRGRGAYVEFDPPTEFVATGPYRWVRNPIAASLMGAALGEAIAFSSTGMLLTFVVGAVLGHLQVVRVEEPLLRRRFGQRYEDYLDRVPRWIPKPPDKEA